MNNLPRRHHYIPQFFSKEWCDTNGNLSMLDKSNPDKIIPVKTKDFGLQKDLYELNSQIESFFITPFIDNLSSSISEIRNKKWSDLSEKVKNDLYKFIILLDARNPVSIESMRTSIVSYNDLFISLLKLKFSIDEGTEREIKSGLDNGVLIFMMIAMQEIGIKEKDLNKTNDESMKKTLKFCCKLIDLAKGFLPKSYYFDNFYESFFIDEFICKENSLITSDRAIYRKGSYDKTLTLLINISPDKGYFISNDEKQKKDYLSKNHEGKINFFNDSIKEFSTRFIIKK